jgi:hypothetical protein
MDLTDVKICKTTAEEGCMRLSGYAKALAMLWGGSVPFCRIIAIMINVIYIIQSSIYRFQLNTDPY